MLGLLLSLLLLGPLTDHEVPVMAHHPAPPTRATAGAAGSARRICLTQHQTMAITAVYGGATVPDPQASDRQGQPAVAPITPPLLAVPYTLPAEA